VPTLNRVTRCKKRDLPSKKVQVIALVTVIAATSTIVYCSHQMEKKGRIAGNLIILERGALRHRKTQ
jgi:ABC-type uncharacterized transport system ATPase subunit